MTTATTQHSFRGRLRMVALAGTLALGAMMPATPPAFASGDTGAVPTVTEQFDVEPAQGIDGLTAVVDAEGEGVNLRAEPAGDAPVVMPLSEGTVVNLRIDQVDTVYDPDGITRWWPVAIGGHDGWVSGFYLADSSRPTATEAAPSDGTAETASARTPVTRAAYDYTGSMVAEISADGEGLVLRVDPDRSSAAVTSIPEGALVDLRIDVADTVYDAQGTRWWPVTWEGHEGWVSGFYLIEPGTEAPGIRPEADATAVFGVGDLVRVQTPSGRGLVVRVDPVPEGERLTSLHEEQEVRIVDGPASHEGSDNGWYLVSTGEVTGYVDGDLLALVEVAVTETPVATEAPAERGFAVGDWAEIRTDDGDGVDLRAGASGNSDTSGYAPNQGLVEILSGPADGWYEVRWDTQTGYIRGELLTTAKAPSRVEREVTPTETPEAPEQDAFRNGDHAKVSAGSGVGVNIRKEATQDAERAGYLEASAVVKITDGPKKDAAGNAWYRVTDGGQSGWVRGDLLSPSEAPDRSGESASDTAPKKQNSSTGFTLPLASYRFTQDYGCSSLGFYTYDAAFGCSVHDGLDLAAPAQTPIHAVQDGTVVASGWCDCGLGYYVEIDHGDGLHTIYGHMASQPYVAVNQKVVQGDVIGPVGSTGLSTGPHTHFMVRQDGVTQDPKNYLPPLT